VEIECLPADIPTEFKVDVSGLALNAQLRASDLPIDKSKWKLAYRAGARAGARGHAEGGRREARGSGGGGNGNAGRAEVIKKGKKKWKAKRALRKKPSPRRRRPKRAREEVARHRVKSMRLIVGLGNPDPDIQWTPHNLGFMAVDELGESQRDSRGTAEGKALAGRGKIAGKT